MAGQDKKSRTCAVMEHHNFLAQTDGTYRANRRAIESTTKMARLARTAPRTAVIRIPVVVHVIYNKNEENLSQEQIESQIDALNRDFRFQNDDRADIPAPFKSLAVDTLIEFALAVRDPQGNPTSGITRTQTSKSKFPYNPNDQLATEKLDNFIKHDEFGKTGWPRDSYLNLWVCTLENGLLGYAQFPGGPAATDGVVINNTAFGSGGTAEPPFDLGRTAVHEVGHWLNLLHIWGDDHLSCSGSDNVDDTPNQGGSNGGDLTKDSFPHISCNNGPHGDMFMNFMDYVNDDTMVMFTKGQLERMNATLSGFRASLLESLGLTPVLTDSIATLSAVTVAASAVPDEMGVSPQLEFDGVSWVPVA